jgi:hypothetical protein
MPRYQRNPKPRIAPTSYPLRRRGCGTGANRMAVGPWLRSPFRPHARRHPTPPLRTPVEMSTPRRQRPSAPSCFPRYPSAGAEPPVMSQVCGGAAPEKTPAQKAADRNRRTISQFSVAGTYCSWTLDNSLRPATSPRCGTGEGGTRLGPQKDAGLLPQGYGTKRIATTLCPLRIWFVPQYVCVYLAKEMRDLV